MIDFKQLNSSIRPEDVEPLIGAKLHQHGNQYRTACIACNQGGDRAIVITPGKNLFYCFASKKGGDLISLVAHVMEISVREAAELIVNEVGAELVNSEQLTVSKKRANSSPEQKGRETAPTFDPEAFAQKLAYTDEVKNLGFGKEEADRFSIGFYKGFVYFPVRDSNGQISGFLGYSEGKLKLPPKWLPQGNVVKFPKSA